MSNKRYPLLISALFLFLCVMVLVSLNMGVVKIAPLDVFRTLIGQGTERQELVLFNFRLPTVVLALFVGAGLAVSGAILQGVTQNDLAEPGILGINTGAGLAVILYIFFFQQSMTSVSDLGIYFLPLFAFGGALAAALIIYALAWEKGIHPIRLLLVGIGVNAGFSAVLMIFQVKMNPQDFSQALVWLAGDLWMGNWNLVLAVVPAIVVLIGWTLYKSRTLNAMNLGDSVSMGLGVRVEKERGVFLILAVGLAGLSVAAGGGIAFLGLVAPHIARRIVGPGHERMIPVASLIGAVLLVTADMIGKNIIAPAEIPVGIIVSLVSTPYFVYLLMKT
ncbi:iron complex transport system permease protein [Halobacillus karajensis]|uniref:Iron-uptake system permease protein FeuC n=1 Tax=Halobacillus karajensis TaxID=195088 RepID=A0A024P8E1_9BACI|nr:iron ABC transporter permease [Halobacillus karajensis]CDQ21454.1 Iron-uptake system permease protein FeuC [Halobacillus karajensis]CDQ25389.1 Iron-uptake system permease protein FeuC [Halobacillus karajensis]CDQ29713.1 Iron-uptake system permease protein FeuC [Halobacillus karajensis]SEI07816.1 iron complex transport system permease protein [Halobacillus karajensis]